MKEKLLVPAKTPFLKAYLSSRQPAPSIFTVLRHLISKHAGIKIAGAALCIHLDEALIWKFRVCFTLLETRAATRLFKRFGTVRTATETRGELDGTKTLIVRKKSIITFFFFFFFLVGG